MTWFVLILLNDGLLRSNCKRLMLQGHARSWLHRTQGLSASLALALTRILYAVGL